MPNIKSAVKRARQAIGNRIRNRSEKAHVASMRRKLFDALETKDVEKARPAADVYASVLDKAVKKGIIPNNTADRRKSRAALALAKLTPAKT
jgi:small subunit ribosomal protein S20